MTSVKRLTGLAALEIGMLQLQEGVCLHQHQPIHVPQLDPDPDIARLLVWERVL